ncbi:MAG: efflux RND transporter periplasmic adaptor subunit [Salinivirgaceae bacterium]|nr:efflux RND transporter periplasmic adaptor subunit [Salinivirgaceae bacterium]
MRKTIFIYLATILAFSACNNDKAISLQPQTVSVEKVITSEDSIRREFPFISKAYQSSELSFRVGGPLVNFEIQTGDYFKKGELIASIDQRDFLLNKESKESQYIRAKAEFERVKSLYEKKNVSKKILDNAKANYSISKTAYETAVNALNDTRLTAPFNGYIQNTKAEAYQVVRANQLVLSFINIEQLKLESFIPEDVSFKSNQIQSIKVAFDALNGVNISASSWDISKSATSNNISFLLTTIIDNKNKDVNLLGGMTGTISFLQPRDIQKKSLMIPQLAVCSRASIGTYVWIYNPKTKTVQTTSVSLGTLNKNAYTEITKGLKENDIVVTSGHNYLSNNMKVQITNN